MVLCEVRDEDGRGSASFISTSAGGGVTGVDVMVKRIGPDGDFDLVLRLLACCARYFRSEEHMSELQSRP